MNPPPRLPLQSSPQHNHRNLKFAGFSRVEALTRSSSHNPNLRNPSLFHLLPRCQTRRCRRGSSLPSFEGHQPGYVEFPLKAILSLHFSLTKLWHFPSLSSQFYPRITSSLGSEFQWLMTCARSSSTPEDLSSVLWPLPPSTHQRLDYCLRCYFP